METPVVFLESELIYLHSRVRADCQGIEQWRHPPASRTLNDALAESISLCAESQTSGRPIREAAILLDYQQCLAIDATCSWYDKDSGAKLIGSVVLLKVFKARRELAGMMLPTAREADGTPIADAEPTHTMDEMLQKLKRKPRRKKEGA